MEKAFKFLRLSPLAVCWYDNNTSDCCLYIYLGGWCPYHNVDCWWNSGEWTVSQSTNSHSYKIWNTLHLDAIWPYFKLFL